MSVSLTGDLGKLLRFQEAIETAPELLDTIAKNLAEETIELIRDGIAEGVDPYGEKYEPLKLRDGQPLRDTGGLQIWQRRFVGREGFAVSSTKAYAAYHQEGTGLFGPKKKKIQPVKKKALRFQPRGGAVHIVGAVKGTPQRRMVPDDGTLPTKWRARYIETARDVIAEHFTR